MKVFKLESYHDVLRTLQSRARQELCSRHTVVAVSNVGRRHYQARTHPQKLRVELVPEILLQR